MLGMKVKIQFIGKLFSEIADSSSIYRNVTEIHYQYREGMIAFESDIHSTGITWKLVNVREFEATAETEKAEAF